MADLVSLRDCPPGLFRFGETIGFKTEYRGMETIGPLEVPGSEIRWVVGRHSEVYVVESGEAFWGGVRSKDAREDLLVTPVCLASVSSASAEPRKDTVAFVQDWLMNSDYDPTQFDKGFAAAIDARHGFDDAALTAIAERFCAAPLPDTVCADLVAIKPMAGRTGTNLMTVAEAKAVLRSIFPEPVPATNQAGEVENGSAQTLKYQGCNRPPDGWWCCSEPGHDGPCPTRRMGEI